MLWKHAFTAFSVALAPAFSLAQSCTYGEGQTLPILLHNGVRNRAEAVTRLRTQGLSAVIQVGKGAPQTVEIDTGSSAIAMPLANIGDGSGTDYTILAKDQPYGYVSSGNSYVGTWVLAPVTIRLDQSDPATFTTVAMPIYGVTQFCKPGKGSSKPVCTAVGKGTSGQDGVVTGSMGMMGVSYAPYAIAGLDMSKLPSTNLFLNLGSQTPGYVITANSVQAGLNQTNAKGFGLLPLEGTAARPSPHACVSYKARNGQSGPFCDTTLLMDTGINHFYMTMPKNACPAAGATISLSAPTATDPALSFSFKAGPPPSGPSPMTPVGVVCLDSETEAGALHHVNTGRMVLAGMDYMYDAACKAVGFRPVPSAR